MFLKNPHSILEILRSRPKDVSKVVLSRTPQGIWADIEGMARSNRIAVSEVTAAKDGISLGTGAEVLPRDPTTWEHFIKNDRGYGVWVALDCVQDPQNVGSIFRTAAFFGVRGILFIEDRAAPLSATVYDVAAGGVECVPHIKVTNLRQALSDLKEADIWILGTSEHAKISLSDVKLDRSWCIVVGNEEKGIRRLTEESCDQVVGLPPQSERLTSLNVAVFTGICLGHLGSRRG